VSQLLVLARPRSDSAIQGDADYAFYQTDNPALVAGARLALGVTDDDAVYVVASPNGDPFEMWFDTFPFDAEQINRLVDACARTFSALAFFYGDASDLDRASDLGELKRIIRLQFLNTPVELYVAWTE
jgi:hypothetical protein